MSRFPVLPLRGELSAVLPASSVAVPPGVTAGVTVFDRHSGRITEQLHPDLRFRSASVVKLLIALDLLWDRGPAYELTLADRTRLEVMLRSSDDDAASHYWDELGGGDIVDRMVARLGLTHTTRPPATHPGFWGYVAITPADTVRIYLYLLEHAPAPVRELVMDHLHHATRNGTDGFDQYFGIASVFEGDFAIKQGWSGFAGSSGFGSDRAKPDAAGIDLTSEALHTTGTVGPGDRTIVAVYTLHPAGTAYEQAYADVTRLVGTLNIPGGTPAAELPGVSGR
ncbi:hypothetical protein [Kribbella sp. ALI-6-A]|uniref:hypothetical protein n=1 Tax=Kribbella sp. ALI-6-A TaxID=1933817 RepID=UPI001EDC54B7|nr:hypothetical protein [Kribbella sp. ALI-6-A]